MKKLFILVLAFMFLISGASAFASGEVLDVEQSVWSVDILLMNQPTGQSWTTGSEVENLKIFQSFMRNRWASGTPLNPIYLDIYLADENDFATGGSLGQTSVAGADLFVSTTTGDGEWESFIFPTEIVLNPNTKYVAIFTSEYVDELDAYYLGRSSTSVYPNGKYILFSSGSWTAMSAQDLMFKTWYLPVAVCDSEHLELCLTQGECVGAGGYWWSDTCHSEEETFVCDSEHLELCLTQGECVGAGGYWWYNACHSEELLRSFSEIIVPASTTPALLGMMSGFVGDMWQFIALIIGLPLGFWGVAKVIELVKRGYR